MREVSDAFLLNMATISATLIGLFLVGVSSIWRAACSAHHARVISGPYLRAGTRITLVVFAIPLGLSLVLVALEPVWARVLFAALSLLLLAANVDSIVRIRGVRSIALLANEAVASVLAVLIVVVPWSLGGLHPTREDLTWSILRSFAAGFLSVSATVMSAFDIARLEATRGKSVADCG